MTDEKKTEEKKGAFVTSLTMKAEESIVPKHIKYTLRAGGSDGKSISFKVHSMDEEFLRSGLSSRSVVHTPTDPNLMSVVSCGHTDICWAAGSDGNLSQNKIFLHGTAPEDSGQEYRGGRYHKNPGNQTSVVWTSSYPREEIELIRRSILDWDRNWKGWKAQAKG